MKTNKTCTVIIDDNLVTYTVSQKRACILQ